ncbi:MAG: nucleotidyltransferase domain-containing protein [Sphingomicrobium sp.]
MYRHLQDACADLVPSEVLYQLREEYIRAAARSMSLAAELCAITRLLEGQGIAPLPYKGPVLALQAYGDIAMRTFTDIDLLVRRRDVSKAREILGSRGYSPIDELTPPQERAILRLDHNLPLVNSTGDILVELHWSVAPAAFTFPIPMEELWERATPIALGDETVRGMSVDDLMLLLPVHGARHAWAGVEWIIGIAELIRKPGSVRWDRIISDAEQLHVARIVRLGVALANRLLDAPIPAPVARWIDDDPRIPRLVAWVAARLFTPTDCPSAKGQWALFKFEMAIKDGAREQIRDGFRRVMYPSVNDWVAVGLPDVLFPLYHVIRPGRLLARYLRHAVRGKAEKR